MLKSRIFAATAMSGALAFLASPAQAGCEESDSSYFCQGESQALLIESDADSILATGSFDLQDVTAITVTASVFSFENSGLIRVTGTTPADAVLINAMRGSSGPENINFRNTETGVIYAGAPGGTAVNIGSAVGLLNEGTILGAGAAIRAGGASYVENAATGSIGGLISLGADSTFVNKGAVEGRLEILEGINHIENSGLFMGDIVTGAGDDTFILSGRMDGNVDLGDGANHFTLTGTLNGKTVMGEGQDTVEVAAGATFDGNAWIDAGAGLDTLVLSGDSDFSLDGSRVDATESILKKDAGSVTLRETLNATNGFDVEAGTLRLAIQGQITGDGRVEEGATYIVDGQHRGFLTSFGTLGGTGEIGVDELSLVQNAGRVSPGMDSIGTLNITGDYQQWSTGVLDIQLGSPGFNDVLAVSGIATLDGTVNFIPTELTDTAAYTFVRYGSHSGEFAELLEMGGAPSGLFYSYSVDYFDDHAVVNVIKTGSSGGGGGGCTPSSPSAGANVICTAPATATYSFTVDSLDILVDDLISLEASSPFITTTGNGVEINLPSGNGVVNTGDAGAIVVRGDNTTINNAGTIDANAGEYEIINLSPATGSGSLLVNTGTIGHAGAAIAIGSRTDDDSATGVVTIYNSGTIAGSIQGDRSEGYRVYNGFGTTGVQVAGASMIDGNLYLTDSADTVANAGTIDGFVRTRGGADSVINFENGVIEGFVDLGAGDDIFEQRGAGITRGDITAGAGDDLVDIHGTVQGNISLGLDDDRLILRNTPTFGTATSINGDEGTDTLELFANTGALMAEQITGFEKLDKSGGGVSIVTGDWDLANGVEVFNGRLALAGGSTLVGSARVRTAAEYQVNGTHVGNVQVDTGGVLSGFGAIGTLSLFDAGTKSNLSNAGTVSTGVLLDGSEISALHVYGDYTQLSSGTLFIDLGAPGESDLLEISGTASLAGAVQFQPIDASALGSYTFLTAAGGVSGQFGTINPDTQTAQGTFFTYTLDYTHANQVSVAVTRTGTGGPGDPGDPEDPILQVLDNLTGNQQAVYDAFVSPGAFTSDLAAVRASLNGIDADLAAGALDSFSGEIHAATPRAIADRSDSFAAMVAMRGLGEKPASNRNLHAWSNGLADWSHTDGQDGRHRIKTDTHGVALGLDIGIGDGRIGMAAGYGTTDVGMTAMDSKADIKGKQLAVYVDFPVNGLQLGGQLSRGWYEVDTRRTLITGNTSTRTALSDAKASDWRAEVAASGELPAGRLAIRPAVSGTWSSVRRDAVTETGAGDAGLEVKRGKAERLTFRAGGEVAIPMASVEPFARAFVAHDAIHRGDLTENALIGGGESFTIESAERGRTGVDAGLGLRARSGPATFSIRYDIEAREDYIKQQAGLTASIRF